MKYSFEDIEPKKLSYQLDFRVLNKVKEKEYLSYFGTGNLLIDMDHSTILLK